MRSTHIYLENLELLCTNNKLMFKYVMKLVTDLGVSSSPKQMLCFPNAMAHEGNLLFYFHFFSSLCVDRVSNELVNVESRRVH